ncbi:MAG: ATP-binding protein [Gemmatimonadota bacterium]|nr:ATP-binding protein [Gemmatimonadota bacterium]
MMLPSPSQLPSRWVSVASWLGPWLATGLLSIWISSPTPWLLVSAALAIGPALFRVRRTAKYGRSAALTILVLTVVTGFVAHHRVDGLLSGWDAYWTEREARVGEVLVERLEQRQTQAETAADALADKAIDPTDQVDIEFVRRLRARHQISALALYDAEGGLILWDGTHWGKVPESVQGGFLRHTYYDRPLFGYLYVTALTEDGRVAMAADLLRADLPEVLEAGVEDFASRFHSELGEEVRVTQYDPGAREGVWDLALPDRRLMSVVVDRPEPELRAAEVMDRWRSRMAALVLVSWGLLAMAAPPRRLVAGVGAVVLLAMAAVLPVDALPEMERLFRVTLFTMPGGLSLSLGRWVLVALASCTVMAVVRLPRRKPTAWLSGLVGGLVYAGLLAWTRTGGAPSFLAEGRLEWITYEVGLATTLAIVTGALLTTSRARAPARWHAPAAGVVAAGLGVGAAVWVWLAVEPPLWWWLLWGLPFGLAATGVQAYDGWRRTGAIGVLAAVMAGSASIPATWGAEVRGEMDAAIDRLEGLTSRDDPVLAGGLLRLAAAADSLDRAGREGVDVLYHAWRASGLAGEGRPVRLTRWHPDGFRGVELRVGAERVLPGVLPTLLAEQRESTDPRLLRLNRDDARYVLTVPLSDGGVLSVVAPPFSERTRPSPLDPFVRRSDRSPSDAMTLIPLLPGDARDDDELRWAREGTEWRAEVSVRFANDRAYHAHHAVVLPGPLQALARGTLLLALNVVLAGGFWLLGRSLLSGDPLGVVHLRGLTISFRARVTWALFGFFALANALFGTVAYRTLSQASYRSAEVIAERVVDDAAVWYRALSGGVDRLARQVGADLVVYREGELDEGSVDELIELGLYDGWTPFGVHQTIDGMEGVKRFTQTQLGRWEYVTAFRRLPDGDILAAQVPLQAGTAAIQASELVELLAFFVLLGAALSLGLAMLAGRALTRPIRALQVASERVGSGNLDLRLPEERTDEFGAVFRAFNRMVGRVRRARRQLLRTSRRTQLIMDEAAVGMLAVDPGGRITLVNPRARELLGEAVVVGEVLRSEGTFAKELGEWLDGYLEHDAERADHELQSGARRIRVRARRLGPPGSRRGAVVAMDDVTDELRAERVLAWGEMARQVAHEVKNPLTPIKLSVQHIRRAWEDGRSDFETILLRNATAMLAEIDRLAEIAQSFSRFGAPAEAGVPLGPVSVADSVRDVLALYGSSVASVRFTRSVPSDLPPVVARTAELKEVLVNLLENARLASGEGDEVQVRAYRDEQGDGAVVLEIVDEGAGIGEEVLPRIFEPQFSTRSTGAGLGLAIVQRLVRSWGAEISVESREGAGTAVRVRLRPWEGDAPGGSGPYSPW